MKELQGFIDPTYLRQMTTAYANGSMPAALRGTPFTDEQFEKASKTWATVQQKIKESQRGRSGKSVRSGDSSSSSSKRTATVADVGSDEDSELDDQDDGSYVDESSEGEK